MTEKTRRKGNNKVRDKIRAEIKQWNNEDRDKSVDRSHKEDRDKTEARDKVGLRQQ